MRKITIILLAALTSLLVGGCSVYDKDTCGPSANGRHRIVMDLVVPSAQQTKAATKADAPWSEEYDYEDGEFFDNYIDLDNLQIFFCKNDGVTVVAALEDYEIVEVARTATDQYEKEYAYQVMGEVPGENLTPGEYKVVILANCPKLAAGASLTDLPQVADFFAEGQYIPMWGMKKQSFKFVNGEVDEIGKVSLLRATAKLEVVLNWNQKFKDERTADELAAIELVSAELLWGPQAIKCLPSATFASIDNTEAAMQEGCFNPVTTTGTVATYDPAKSFALNASKDTASFRVPEYTIGSNPANASDKAVLKLVIKDNSGEKTFFVDPMLNAKETPDGPGAFVRNHLYRFNVVYYTEGKLYIYPTVSDWTDAPKLDYTIKMSTNMRLFDSWLYRYDTDGEYGGYVTDEETGEQVWKDTWGDWKTSHMAISSGRVTTPVAPETVAGRPLYSPQIQLVTTSINTDSFDLVIDNSQFELVRANKDETGVVTSYDASADGKLHIAGGDNVYTYFYIVPKVGVTPTNPVAKVTLIYNDGVLGPQKVPFNYGSLPGYSDDSSEIWAYYFPEDQYNIDGKLKMYYQDSANPLVPTPVQS